MRFSLVSLSLFTAIFAALIGCSSAPKKAAPPSCLTVLVDHWFDGRQEHREEKTFTVASGFVTERPGLTCATTLDLRKKTVLPGLIDAHTHVLLTDRTFGTDFAKELVRETERPMPERIAEAKTYLRSLLFAGFTSIRDLGNSGAFEDLKLKNHEPAPQLFGSGPGIASATAQFPTDTSNDLVSKEYRILSAGTDTKASITSFITENQTRGADAVKVYADNDPQPGMMKQEWLNDVVREAHARGLRVAAHATTDEAALRAVKAGADTIEHGLALSPQTLSLMKQKNVILVATDFSTRACEMIAKHDTDPLYHPCSKYSSKMSKRLLAARKAGVTIAFGSDMYLALEEPLNDRGLATLDSLYALMEEGLSPIEALTSATTNAAKAIGRADIGHLGEHSRADLVAYDGDPIADLRELDRPALVMKDGRVVCGLTTEIKCH